MEIDWPAVATITAPTIALLVGVWVTRRFESRPVLISYFGHVSTFTHTPPNGTPFDINTHSVSLHNAGRRGATNVRLHHLLLPDFNIRPSIVHHVEDLPDGTKDIVIPTLVPGEEITISYLYWPPTTVTDINAGIKGDQGFAQAVPVLLQRQYPDWISFLVVSLMFVGFVSIVYLLYWGIGALLR